MESNNEFTVPDDPTRHFGGKLSNYTDKEEQKREQKHLSAYLRGYDSFNYGYETKLFTQLDGTQKEYRAPKVFKVQEIWS